MKTLKKIIFLVTTILIVAGGKAQKQASKEWIDTTKHKGLTELNIGYPFKVFVSNDKIKSISETTKNLDNAKSYFDQLFQIDLKFSVLFIENEHWNQYAYFPPPGIPQAWRGNIILGLDKSFISKQVESSISHLPEQQLQSLKKAYGENINLDLFYREALSVHELAHLYHLYYGTQPQRKWLQELFANMSMYSFAKNKCTPCYDLINAFPIFSAKLGDGIAEYKSLDDFEEKYLGNLHPQNYEWFQFQFYFKAKDIIDNNDETILVRLRDFLERTDLSENERLSDEELVVMLEKEVGKDISEVLTGWKYD